MKTIEELDPLREPLSKFVLGYVRDRHAAEDLVQDTLLRAVRNLHRYRGQAALKTWVFTIARNLCLDYLRAPARSRLRLLDSLEPGERDRTLTRLSDPGEDAAQDESRDQVVEALGRLSPEARNLLILRIYMGLSYREIARRRGGAPAGVGTRLGRALKGLSRRLAQA